MNTSLPCRPAMDSRINVLLPRDEKQRLFELAAAERVPVSEIIRRALSRHIASPQEGEAA